MSRPVILQSVFLPISFSLQKQFFSILNETAAADTLKCGTIIQWSLGMTRMLQDLASPVTRKMSQNKISQYY